jgi:hypothetical protein
MALQQRQVALHQFRLSPPPHTGHNNPAHHHLMLNCRVLYNLMVQYQGGIKMTGASIEPWLQADRLISSCYILLHNWETCKKNKEPWTLYVRYNSPTLRKEMGYSETSVHIRLHGLTSQKMIIFTDNVCLCKEPSIKWQKQQLFSTQICQVTDLATFKGKNGRTFHKNVLLNAVIYIINSHRSYFNLFQLQHLFWSCFPCYPIDHCPLQ